MAAVRSWREHTDVALREAGFRAGGARAAVLDLMAGQDCCASAQEIHETLRGRARSVGIASVYRVLDVLAELRLVQRVDVGDGIARFEPALPDGDHHHHVVCDDCGKVEPFSDSSLETRHRAGVEAAGLQRRRARGRAARRVRRLPRRALASDPNAIRSSRSTSRSALNLSYFTVAGTASSGSVRSRPRSSRDHRLGGICAQRAPGLLRVRCLASGGFRKERQDSRGGRTSRTAVPRPGSLVAMLANRGIPWGRRPSGALRRRRPSGIVGARRDAAPRVSSAGVRPGSPC